MQNLEQTGSEIRTVHQLRVNSPTVTVVSMKGRFIQT